MKRVTQSSVDHERIAALLEGRLDPSARAELLATLGATQEGADILAESIAIESDLRTDARPMAVLMGAAPRRTPRWFERPTRWVAIAAVLASVAILPRVLRTGAAGTAGSGPDFATIRGLLAAPAGLPAGSPAGLPASFDLAPWGAVRGSLDDLAPQARAVRIGARLIDLDLLVQARDTLAARMAGEIATLLDGAPGASSVASAFRALSGLSSVVEMQAPLREASANAAAIVGPASVAAGAWLEAARVAADRGDSAFFRDPASASSLDAAQRLGGSAEDRARVVDIRSGLRASPLDLRVIAERSAALLGILAR